jgi:uncharacterized protein (DUF1778 family)
VSEQEYIQTERAILDAANKNDFKLMDLLEEAASMMPQEMFIALTDRVIRILSEALQEIREQTEKRPRVRV